MLYELVDSQILLCRNQVSTSRSGWTATRGSASNAIERMAIPIKALIRLPRSDTRWLRRIIVRRSKRAAAGLASSSRFIARA